MDNLYHCFLLRSAQLPLRLHRTTGGRQRRSRTWKSHWCDDGFARLVLLQSRPGSAFGQSCFLGTFAWWWLWNRAKTRKILCDWVAWWTPPTCWIFCAFFCCHFLCHLSYHSTNPSGPSKQRGTALVPNSVRFYIRLKTRPRSGTVTETLIMCTRTVYYCGHRMWQRFSSSSGFCSSGYV